MFDNLNGNYVIFNHKSLEKLNNVGTTVFFALCIRLAMKMENESNLIKVNKNNVRELSKEYGIGINNINELINLAKKIGVIIEIETYPETSYLYNPYIAQKRNVDLSVYKLFDLTIFNQYSNEELNNLFTKPKRNLDNIYIISQPIDNNNLIYKIGRSNNIESRLNTYLSTNPSIKIMLTLMVENPVEFEKKLHQKYKAIFKNEWYDYDTMKTINDEYNFNLTL